MKDLSFINDIKSMAVIGTSAKRNFFFLKNHQESFKGSLYAINPTVKEIPGFPKENLYKSIKDVPEVVDFAFITVPAKQVISVIDECIEKGVKLVSIFSAEFSDAGTEEGRALEKELLKHADNKIRLLGPNGMGLFYPKLGIAWRAFFPNTQGNIGLIAQSGGMNLIASRKKIQHIINQLLTVTPYIVYTENMLSMVLQQYETASYGKDFYCISLNALNCKKQII